MATAVYDVVEVELQDAQEVTLRPLPINQLRRFMAAWKEMSKLKEMEEDELEDASMTVYVNCAGIALENQFLALEKFPKTRGTGKDPLSKEYREYLEQVLDMDTIYKIFEVCVGLKLNDPNLLAAIAQAQENQD